MVVDALTGEIRAVRSKLCLFTGKSIDRPGFMIVSMLQPSVATASIAIKVARAAQGGVGKARNIVKFAFRELRQRTDTGRTPLTVEHAIIIVD